MTEGLDAPQGQFKVLMYKISALETLSSSCALDQLYGKLIFIFTLPSQDGRTQDIAILKIT